MECSWLYPREKMMGAPATLGALVQFTVIDILEREMADSKLHSSEDCQGVTS